MPGFVDVQISTKALISELRKRSPKRCADRCEHIGSEVCGGCIWGMFIGDHIGGIMTPNFKERKNK